MFNLLTRLSDIVFPPRPTALTIANLDSTNSNHLYSPGTFNSVVYLTNYQNPTVKAVITENKFYNSKVAAHLSAAWLGLWTKHQIMNTLYVPTPLSSKRKRERGYNQVENILTEVKPKIKVNSKIVTRHRHTKPQAELSREERLNNLSGAFSVNLTKIDLSDYQQIVIVDDVVTTGTTINEVRATLAPHVPPHIKITCLAIAH